MMKKIIYILLLLSVYANAQSNLRLLEQLRQQQIDTVSPYPTQVDLTTITWTDYTDPSGGLPAYKTPAYVDPISGFNTYRISDETAFGIGDTEAKIHAYSRRQPFNSDASLILTSGNSGKVLDGSTFDLLGQIEYQIVWSNVTPTKGYGSYSNVFETITVNMSDYSFDSVITKTFSAYTSMTMDGSNGEISNDDKYVALSGVKSGSTDCWVVVYDIETDTIISETNLGTPISNVGYVSISQDGNFVVINYLAAGVGSHQGLKSYDRSLGSEVALTETTGHGDCGVDAVGNQVYVYWISGGVGSYELGMVRLSDGTFTGLFPNSNGTLYSGHVSCRNINRPGWAYISHYQDPIHTGNAAQMENFAIKLDGSNLIERWGRNNSSRAWDTLDEYYQQPHGVPSPDGTQFVFASAWADTTEEAKTYGYLFLTQKADRELPATDTDADAFITATGITDTTQKSAINTLVVDLKAAGLWTKMLAIYPLVGGSATTHKYNLKDPRDLDAAYRITFTGTFTHDSSGLTGIQANGSRAANTNLNMNELYQDDNSMFYYDKSERSTTGGAYDIGVGDMYLSTEWENSDENIYSSNSGVYGGDTSNGTTLGFWGMSRLTSTVHKIYHNGTVFVTYTGAATSALYSSKLSITGINTAGAASPDTYAFACFGRGLTDSEVSDLYDAVLTFETTLGRQN